MHISHSLSLLCSRILQLPIIPIGTALSFLLLFVLYAAFVTDLHRQCSAPLHGFAIISLLLFLYAPNHRTVKYHLFAYSRERDGPTRPRGVRVYDQIFQTVCILYIYCKYHLLVYFLLRFLATDNINRLGDSTSRISHSLSLCSCAPPVRLVSMVLPLLSGPPMLG